MYSQIADDVDEALYAEEPKTNPPSSSDTLVSKHASKPEPREPPKRQLAHEDADLYGMTEETKTPTIASLSKNTEDLGAIPGLGEISSEPAEHPTDPSPPPPAKTTKEPPKTDRTDKMLASLGKLMTELQGLKGLTSSLQLLQSLPRAEEKQEQVSEKEVSEEAKQKAAALLANESDSDGESQVGRVCVCVCVCVCGPQGCSYIIIWVCFTPHLAHFHRNMVNQACGTCLCECVQLCLNECVYMCIHKHSIPGKGISVYMNCKYLYALCAL